MHGGHELPQRERERERERERRRGGVRKKETETKKFNRLSLIAVGQKEDGAGHILFCSLYVHHAAGSLVYITVPDDGR